MIDVILLYGTSEKLFDIENRDIEKIKAIMFPHIGPTQGEKPKQDQTFLNWLLIRPYSTFHKIWSLVLTIAYIYSATIMLYWIALINDYNDWAFYFNLVVDFVFLFDVFVNFNLPYKLENGKYEYNRKMIAKHYLRTWFIIDLCAGLPIALVTIFTL
jgi:hypothetical protein